MSRSAPRFVTQCLALFAAVGCRPTPVTPHAEALATARLATARLARPQESARAPIEASWVVVHADAHRTVLRALVARAPSWTLPVNVSISLPQSVRLVRGVLATVLPAVTEKPVVAYQLELAHTTPPIDDVVLVVDSADHAMGAHARVPYRFGRAEAALDLPPATGPALTVAGRSFGPAVRVQR